MNKKILTIALVFLLVVSLIVIVIDAGEVIEEVVSKLSISLTGSAKSTLVTGDENTTFQGAETTPLECNDQECKFTIYKEGVINKEVKYPSYYTEPILINVTRTEIVEHSNQTEAGTDPETNETIYEYVYWNETIKTTTQEQNGSLTILYSDQELVTQQEAKIVEVLEYIAEVKASRIAEDYTQKNEAKELVL